MPPNDKPDWSDIDKLLADLPDTRDEQIAELQKKLDGERDARQEERFAFIVLLVLLLDVVFFSVLDTLAGPIALLVLVVPT